MPLIYRLIQTDLENSTNWAAFETLARWYADPAIKYAIRPNFKEELMPDPSAEQLAAGYRLQDKLAWFIYEDDRLIGEVTLDPQFKMLCKPVEKTGWISLIIGEQDCWRRGYGSEAMQFLENTCRVMDLKRIELGVFAFNEPAIRLYQRLGYTECGRLKHFTYKPDRWYDDIRMEKWL